MKYTIIGHSMNENAVHLAIAIDEAPGLVFSFKNLTFTPDNTSEGIIATCDVTVFKVGVGDNGEEMLKEIDQSIQDTYSETINDVLQSLAEDFVDFLEKSPDSVTNEN